VKGPKAAAMSSDDIGRASTEEEQRDQEEASSHFETQNWSN